MFVDSQLCHQIDRDRFRLDSRHALCASATEQLGALEVSVHRLASLVNGMKLAELNQQAYPSKWSVADVLSHLGSGAVIMQRGIDAAVSGHPVEEGFNQSVWD